MNKLKIFLMILLLGTFCYSREISPKEIEESFRSYGINEVKVERLSVGSIEIKVWEEKKEEYPIHKRKVYTESVILDNSNGNLDFFITLVDILETLKLDYGMISVRRYCDKLPVGQWTISEKSNGNYSIMGDCIDGEGNFIDWKKEGKWEYDSGYLVFSNGKLEEERLYSNYILYDENGRNIEEGDVSLGSYIKSKYNEKGDKIYIKEVTTSYLAGQFIYSFNETIVDGRNKKIISGNIGKKDTGKVIKSYWIDDRTIASFSYAGSVDIESGESNLILDGSQIIFYPNGNIKMEAKYDNGELYGKQVKYYKNGNIQEEFFYTNGRLDGHYTKYDEQGNVIKDDLYQINEKNGDIIYTLKGKNEFKKLYSNDKLDGVSEFVFKDKGIHITANYKEGLLNGQWKMTDLEGNIILEENYSNNLLNGIRKFYYKNGKIAQKEKYENGEQIGKIIFYNENGKKIGTKTITKINILKEINDIGDNIYLKVILRGAIIILLIIFINKKMKEREYLLVEVEANDQIDTDFYGEKIEKSTSIKSNDKSLLKNFINKMRN